MRKILVVGVKAYTEHDKRQVIYWIFISENKIKKKL